MKRGNGFRADEGERKREGEGRRVGKGVGCFGPWRVLGWLESRELVRGLRHHGKQREREKK
jgi:hypothetical protein